MTDKEIEIKFELIEKALELISARWIEEDVKLQCECFEEDVNRVGTCELRDTVQALKDSR